MVRRVRDQVDRRRVIVEPARGTREGDASFFGAIQSVFETLVVDFSDRQLETILELMRRATARTRAITAELTGARQAGNARLLAGKRVENPRPRSQAVSRKSA